MRPPPRISTAPGTLPEAAKQVFGGTAYMRNFGAASSVRSSVGLAVDTVAWDVDLNFSGGGISRNNAETLAFDGQPIISRSFGDTNGQTRGSTVPLGPGLLPRVCAERFAQLPAAPTDDPISASASSDRAALAKPFDLDDIRRGSLLRLIADSFMSYRTYHYEISPLLTYGSRQSSDIVLSPSGENVFPLLRNWRDKADTEERYEFVISALREAFPHVQRVEFEQAGQTTTMSIFDQRWSKNRVPISRESTGLITALLHLCAVASGLELVTIDELETSLHPHAIRVLIAAFRRWSKEHDLRVVLATQSETVLDQFRDEPGQIYVIEPKQDTSPRSLTDMFSAQWLSQFSLGDLFSHLEFGSNGEQPAE